MNFTVNGERICKSTGKFTKKEAKLAEAVEKNKLIEESKLPPREKKARTLFSDAIKKVYTERWKNNKDGMGSLRNAERAMAIIGDIPIGHIDDVAIAKLLRKLDAKKSKPGTVNRYLTAIKTMLRHNKLSTDDIKQRKEPKGRIRVITKEEEIQVLNLLRTHKLNYRTNLYTEGADLVEVLVDTGLRLSEALNLEYKDINFTTNILSIWVNKGDRPRSLPMTSRVKRILEARHSSDTKKPFTIDKHQAGHAWNYARKNMGFKGDKEFVMHALRHTCASRLVNKGIDLYVVKEWLGHSSIQVTEKYAHLAPGKLSEAAMMLEEYE